MSALLILVLTIAGLLLGPSPLRAQRQPDCTSGCVGVSVTPDGGKASAFAGSPGNQVTFAVQNTGLVAATYTLTCSRTGNVTCAGVAPSSLHLDPAEDGEATVTYTAGAVGSGTIKLSASGGGTDNGTYTVSVVVAGPPVVTLRNYNTDNQDKSLCLTTGAGEAAAGVCGDLVVTHAMPGFSTMGRDRALTLVYNSSTAHDRPIVTVAVQEPIGTAQPTTVYVELAVAGVVRQTATYKAWKDSTKQIGIAYDAPGSGHATGVYPFTVSVENQYTGAASQTASVSGTLIVVNRYDSRYGAGVGIAGVEELVFNQPVGQSNGSILWVGGDGSAKLYAPTGTANTWVAPPGAYRDTLTFNPATQEYTRALRHGVQVVFNSAGRHTKTIARTTQQTTFTWNLDTLKSITVPPGGSGTTYTLAYVPGTGLLDRITDPSGRVLDVTVTNEVLASVVDPDGIATTFGYDPYRTLTSRTSRRGFTTRYEFNNTHRLTKVFVPVGRQTGDTATALTQFFPWDEQGLVVGLSGQTAVDTSLVRTRILGPRYPGVADTAAFWIDRWGAPTKIVDAVPATTLIVRGDAANPALPTSVTYANQRVVTMAYNGRANLTQVLDNTAATGNGALPLKNRGYTYPTSGAAIDSPIIVADSINGGAYKVTYQYNGDDLPISTTDRRGHQTRFVYRASGTLRGITDSIVEEQVPVWSVGNPDLTDANLKLATTFTYDSRGNPLTIKAPTGVITSMQVDAVGRVTDAYDPMGLRQQWTYDPLNRVTAAIRFTAKTAHPNGVLPLQGCDATQVWCTDTTAAAFPASYGSSLLTRYGQGLVELDSITDPRLNLRHWVRDARGLVIEDRDEYNQPTMLNYDKGGDLIQSLSRLKQGVFNPHQDTVSVQYDAAGRRTRLIYSATPYNNVFVKGDTLQYQYDVMGNLLSVAAGEASTQRSYYGDGSVRSQRTMLTGGTDSTAYSYDATGARTQMSRTSGGKTDVVTYTYNSTTGDLQTMAVAWGAPLNLTRTFTYVWDALGRRRQITYPQGIVVQYRYDKQGIMRRLVSTNSFLPNDPNVNDRFELTVRADSVDPAGRILFQRTLCLGFNGSDGGGTGSACPVASPGAISTVSRYDRFGMLVTQASGATLQTLTYDVAGNLVRRQDGAVQHFFQIDPLSNRLQRDSTAGQAPAQVAQFAYTGSAGLLRKFTENLATGGDDFERFYYDGLGRSSGVQDLRHDLSDRMRCIRYDADGQAALPCDDNTAWLSFDGSNVAGTLGVRWVFVGGPAVDDPLIALYRSSATAAKELYWVTDGQGRQLAVGVANGSLISIDKNDYLFNGGKFAGGAERGSTFGSSRFEAPNAPGFSFFRNRLYDQSTGRWTQEDPIGVAGGLNLYQFNSNNPVANTDPFGLCPICLVAGVVYGAYELGSAAYDVYNAGRTLLDRNASGTEKTVMLGLAAASVFGPGGGFTAGAERITQVLGQGAELIGRAGRGAGVREVVGSAEEAKALFGKLTEGATARAHPGAEGGLIADLPGGGTVGYRPTSRSGGPAIDIHVEGSKVNKIHFVGE